jgi:HEAT repeat protein
LLDKNDVVRQAASGALTDMSAIAVPALIETLKNRDFQVSRAAADMLNRIGTESALEAVKQWTARGTSKLDERRTR